MLSSRSVSLLHNELDYSSYTRGTSTKTPGRALKGRAGLQENAFQHGSLTANPKEKKVTIQTPFRQKAGGTRKGSLAPSQSRPLGDKTPGPNRQSNSLFTPGPRKDKSTNFKLPVLADVDEGASPAPSSTRKHSRAPRISQTFKTPITKGDHWNVSDISIDLGASTSEVPEANDGGPDYSDPEYMPPRAEELPYEPPVDMPDYKILGQNLRLISRPWVDDRVDFTLDEVDSDDLLQGCTVKTEHMLQLPPYSDEDEIFGPRKRPEKIGTQAKQTSRLKGSTQRSASKPLHTSKTSTMSRIPITRPLVRPATSLAVRKAQPCVKPIVPRPGTSASNARPRMMPSSTSRPINHPKFSSITTTKQMKSSDWVDNGANKLAVVDTDDDADDFRFDV